MYSCIFRLRPRENGNHRKKGGTGLERRADVDWARTASMLGVIFLHASSGFVSRASRFDLLGMTPALLCNQAVRFSVPVFFLLSGLGLGLSRREVGLPGFWLRRFRRSVLPYVLWSAFYFLQSSQFRFSVLVPPAAFGNSEGCSSPAARPPIFGSCRCFCSSIFSIRR